ncbi:MAG TPA: response regulator transcription factor [Thermoanaerobaculia bacterium]|nr:response regulator transcription factor [Thermoanaerobaculia bacterium]
MIRALIADDHPILRRGLAQVLSEAPDVEVTGEAGDADEVIQSMQRDEWDVVVLDLAMPGARGLELLRRLRREHRDVPVVVLSIHPAEQYAMQCLKIGAAAYLNKRNAPEELVEAVRAAAAGRRYLAPEMAERLLEEADDADDTLAHEKLSRREYQVMSLIASGKTVGEIARILDLSVKTVSTYRARLLAKMNLRTNAEITRYAFEHHLVT